MKGDVFNNEWSASFQLQASVKPHNREMVYNAKFKVNTVVLNEVLAGFVHKGQVKKPRHPEPSKMDIL